MSGYEKFTVVIKMLATAAMVFKTLYFGPVGAASGACDGLIFAAIWFF
jgi:hypothetical protein